MAMYVPFEASHSQVSVHVYKLFRHGTPWLFIYATAVVLSVLNNTDKPVVFLQMSLGPLWHR